MSSKPRLLILSTRIPFPLVGGDRIRIYNFCKTLVKEYVIDLLVLSEGSVEHEAITELESLNIKVIVYEFSRLKFKVNALKGLFTKQPLQVRYYYFQEVRDWLERHIGNYQFVLCNHIRSAEYVSGLPGIKILDLHDAVSLNYSRASIYAKGIWKWIYRVENTRVMPYEIGCVRSFDKTLIVSSIDKDYLVRNGASAEKITVVPVAVEEKFLQTNENPPKKNWIVFVGKMDTVANSDAAVYFAMNVFPRIQAVNPNIEFFIVGADPSPDVQQLNSIAGVTVTGRVANHAEYIQQARVVIDPMRFGAGMQNKVLQAMALAKPVVASTLAIEGIGGIDGVHFVVADNEEETANAILQLFKDEGFCSRLGSAAKQFVLEHYSWEVVGQTLLDAVRSAKGTA